MEVEVEEEEEEAEEMEMEEGEEAAKEEEIVSFHITTDNITIDHLVSFNLV